MLSLSEEQPQLFVQLANIRQMLFIFCHSIFCPIGEPRLAPCGWRAAKLPSLPNRNLR